jgi:hypothetical protein
MGGAATLLLSRHAGAISPGTPDHCSNIETNGATTAKRAYVSQFRILYVNLTVFHAT